jgi:hypothetical protein
MFHPLDTLIPGPAEAKSRLIYHRNVNVSNFSIITIHLELRPSI